VHGHQVVPYGMPSFFLVKYPLVIIGGCKLNSLENVRIKNIDLANV